MPSHLCFADDCRGINAKSLSTYMGHSSIALVYDRYGHLMPGNESEAASLLDAYLERAREPQSDARGRFVFTAQG
jgi:integrase